MSNRFWVKDWICGLDDSRIATLPDDTWRVAKECTLVAGEYGTEEGWLPPLPELAFRLRRKEEELQPHLEKLLEASYLVSLKRGLKVRQFAKRQSAVPALDRKRAERSREGTAGYGRSSHENVTTRDQRERKNTDRAQRGGENNKRLPPKGRERYLNE